MSKHCLSAGLGEQCRQSLREVFKFTTLPTPDCQGFKEPINLVILVCFNDMRL